MTIEEIRKETLAHLTELDGLRDRLRKIMDPESKFDMIEYIQVKHQSKTIERALYQTLNEFEKLHNIWRR